MTESTSTPDSTLAHGPVVWEDEIWILARHDGGAAGDIVGLTLHHREDEGLGQLSDDHASQMGRIGNRLIRIIEHLPGAGTVELGRVAGSGHVQLTFEAAGLTDDQLHDVAVKLANWGGEARV